MRLGSLSEARSLDHGILINATGVGSSSLLDVRDSDVQFVRGQTMLVESTYEKLFMRDDGETYTYIIPRGDGTAILGGVRQEGSR